MRHNAETPRFTPAFRELFNLVRRFTFEFPVRDEDWHFQHPLWNLLDLDTTSTGYNLVAVGVRPEGGEPFAWVDAITGNTHTDVSIAHVDLTNADNAFDDKGDATMCFNELTIAGQVLQNGEAFYTNTDPKAGYLDSPFINHRRVLADSEVQSLSNHLTGI
jgi:hypothetical protein